jgi:hypothetical protein
MKHMYDMVERYVVTATDNYGMTREGYPRFLNWLPSEFGATKDYWEEKGTVWTLAEFYIHLPCYWESDSSSPDYEWSST